MSKEFFNPDIEFFLDHRVDWERYFRFARPDAPWREELDTFKMILRTVGEIAESIEDGARDHWHDHVRVEDGKVIVPPHIAAGYAMLKEAGLVSLPVSSEYGGYGLPFLINSAYLEMLSRADSSLMTIVGLQAGAAHDIEMYGSAEIKRRYLPRFASGVIQGCMDLTEAEAGSDLGNITTRATLQGDHYVVQGEKIFITNGGAEVHLVLARDAATFEQTRGTTNGLSLILCPRTLPDGRPNAIAVPRVESKLGIHGSPTCVVQFDGAEGYLLGTAGHGFKAMLDLMNNARLGVAAQAVGIAEGAYRAALEYAGQRVQFGAPILQQPLVKSMLTQMAIHVQAARALLYRTCALVDLTRAMGDYLASERGGKDPHRAELAAEHDRNAHLARFHAAVQVLRDRAQQRGSAAQRAGARRPRLHGRVARRPVPLGLDHHDDLRGHVGDSGELRAEGDEQGRAVRGLDAVSTAIDLRRDAYAPLVDQVHHGIDWIHKSLSAVMGDPRYALLNAKRLCDMVIDVLVAAELLAQAPLSDAKRELATSFIHRRMLVVETNARRIAGGDASRIQRYDTILGLNAQ
jgi:alkylation response protein AidB-like acyl-CoA dehydrogenase